MKVVYEHTNEKDGGGKACRNARGGKREKEKRRNEREEINEPSRCLREREIEGGGAPDSRTDDGRSKQYLPRGTKGREGGRRKK